MLPERSFGYALLQKHDNEWRIVAAGSRYLRDVETRYAMVELEAIAILYGVKQCHLYLAGLPHFDVITDHQPLKTIFNKKDLYEIDNDKLMKIKQELQSKYVFTVDYRKGANHVVPDALSRSPVNDPSKEDNGIIEFGTISAITGDIGIKDLQISWLEDEARKDIRYRELHDAVMTGFEKFKTSYGIWTKTPKYLYVRDFKPHWQNLSTEGDLVILKNRIFVPEECRRKILNELHKGHQGVT